MCVWGGGEGNTQYRLTVPSPKSKWHISIPVFRDLKGPNLLGHFSKPVSLGSGFSVCHVLDLAPPTGETPPGFTVRNYFNGKPGFLEES